jgi:enediyne polyketide synthase
MSKELVRANQIAVIGMGCHYPGANTLQQLWENVLARRQQFRQMPDQRLPLSMYHDPDPTAPDKTYGSRIAVIDEFEFDWSKRRIPRTVVEVADIAHWLALEVAIKAVEDAGYTRGGIPTEKTGVFLGNTLTGEFSRSTNMRMRWPFVERALVAAAGARGLPPEFSKALAETMEKYYKSPLAPVTEDTLSGNLSNTIAGRICNFFDFHGGGYTVDGACASSLIAIANAASALVSGDLDIALAGGVDISLDTFELIGFAKTGALTRGDMTVYDRKASGFIPGEGCGFVVLKRLEDARADQDFVYAILNGWGISSDGKGGLTAPSSRGQAIALRRAYDRAGYTPDTLDFVEGHGTGTPVGDRAELESIALASETEGEFSLRSIGVTSFKSIVGHTKAAAGVGAFIKAALAANRRILPPTTGCKDPNPVFEKSAQWLYPIRHGEIRSKTNTLRAGVSAMGFGGINCHVTLESGDAPATHVQPAVEERSLLVSTQETEVFAFAAASLAELQKKVQSAARMAKGLSACEITDLAAHLSESVQPKLPVRGTVVASAPDQLVEYLGLLEKRLREAPPAQGEAVSLQGQQIWIGNGVNKSQIGFLFPGQGSQKLNMARSLVERYEWARKLLEQADECCQSVGVEPISQFIYRSTDRAINQAQLDEWSGKLANTEIAQPAICLASLLWMKFLKKLGIEPKAVGGHSLGELVAFHAAGTFDETTLLSLAAVRGKLMSTSTINGSSGTMASLACSIEIARKLLDQVDGYVDVANINSPGQTVISGEKASIEQVIELAASRQIQSRRLAVSNGFHSALVADAAERLKACDIIPETIELTEVSLFSSIDGEQVSSGCCPREHFGQQITSPVAFISLVQAMTSCCDLLIEVGPGKVLSGLVDNICQSVHPICLPVESRSESDRDVNMTLSILFVHGCEIRWSALYENRMVRPFIPASKRVFITNPLEKPFQVSEPAIPLNFQNAGNQPGKLPDAQEHVDWSILSTYLAQRAPFLTEIIRSDLKTLPKVSALNVGGDYDLASASISDNSRDHEIRSAKSSDRVTSEPHQTLSSAKTSVSQESSPVEAFIISLVAQQTGFTPESITSETRLLDDLNLDSIKAGELIAAAAQEFDVAGEIDPAPLANARIEEIAESIRAVAPFKNGVNHASTASVQTNVNQSVNKAALNGSLADRNGPKPTPQEPLQPQRKALVRDFVVQPVLESLTPSLADSNNNSSWRTANVLIVCEENDLAIAEALRNKLWGQGSQVRIANFTEAENQRLIQSSEFAHFITVLPRTIHSPLPPKEQIFEAARRLNSLTLVPSTPGTAKSVTYVQFGGGVFGLTSENFHVEQCCAVAFASSIHLERPDLKVRVLDCSSDLSPDSIAECWFTEISAQSQFAAVGYDNHLTRRVPKPCLQEPAQYTERAISWSPSDVILVTGGAKGVTAECALTFARETGAHIILVGRSPHPSQSKGGTSSEVVRTLERFRTENLQCTYYECDVSNFDSVNSVLSHAQAEVGTITGVIHGAAVNIPRRVDQVTTEAAFNEISPKLLGIMNLMRALESKGLKLFAALSSVIGVTGMQRNAWYGFSNEAMDRLLQAYKDQYPEVAVFSTAYSVWEEVGMGARMGSVRSLAKMGIGAIPVEEGVARFLRLVKSDPGAVQVVIAATMRAMSAQKMGGLDTWNPPLPPLPKASRFLEQILVNEPGVEVIARAHLQLDRDIYLEDHVYKGSNLFPTVFGLEAMSQAVACVLGKNSFEALRIENIRLERPIVVSPDRGVDIEVHAKVLERESETEPRQVHAMIRTEKTGFRIDHFSATFVLDFELQVVKKELDLPNAALDIEPSEDLYTWLLFQGPRFQRLKQVYSLDSNQLTFGTEVRASSSSGEGVFADQEPLPLLLGDPYARDSLLQSAQLLIPKDLCLPIEIGSIEIHQPTRNYSGIHIGVTTAQSLEEQNYQSTVFILDGDGNMIERLDGYTTRLLEHREDYPSAEEIANPSERDEFLLRSKLSKAARHFNLDTPEIFLAHLPGLHSLAKSERHHREIPFLRRAISLALHDSTIAERVQFGWSETGKPFVTLENFSSLNISLSHDDQICICVVGKGREGCDVEPITHRSLPNWNGLLGGSHQQLLQRLLDEGENLDVTGTRIWTASEALRKAVNVANIDLQAISRHADVVLFKGIADAQPLNILSFPIKMTRGRVRMIACVVQSLQP